MDHAAGEVLCLLKQEGIVEHGQRLGGNGGEAAARDLPELVLQRQTEPHPNTDNLAVLERETIARVVAAASWNLTQAAKRLGISRTTLYSKLHKHGLSRSFDGAG